MIYHLAQLNIGILKNPIDHPSNKEFVDNLERVNNLGESTPGFIWRLKDEEGASATGIQAYSDPRIIVNFTIWESIESLYQFAYRNEHGAIFKRRSEWFERQKEASNVLWWVPSGEIPTVEEAKERLEHLREYGASPYAFNFWDIYDPLD